MKSQTFTPQSLAETEQIAASLARALTQPEVITLTGDLGAGKSAFARAFLHTCGHDGHVPSPTFTLVQTYDGLGPSGAGIWHVDAYRLEHWSEAEQLGLEDGLDAATCLIEWPQRIAPLIPPSHIAITLERSPRGESARIITIVDNTAPAITHEDRPAGGHLLPLQP